MNTIRCATRPVRDGHDPLPLQRSWTVSPYTSPLLAPAPWPPQSRTQFPATPAKPVQCPHKTNTSRNCTSKPQWPQPRHSTPTPEAQPTAAPHTSCKRYCFRRLGCRPRSLRTWRKGTWSIYRWLPRRGKGSRRCQRGATGRIIGSLGLCACTGR
jgi:hypothetical protein